jgi:hypothetical protein
MRTQDDTRMEYLTREQLDAGLPVIREAPKDAGVLEMIVRRPAVGEREVLEAGELDLEDGLIGDSWKRRGGGWPRNRGAYANTQINVMNARVAALVARDRSRWPLAGDQLFIDMDLSLANLPAGTRLALGGAVIEVTPEPHTGCAKFVQRFGLDAMKFVNSPVGRELCLRGINARVVQPGAIRVGDIARKAL